MRPREQPPDRHTDNARPPLIIPATARTTTGTRDSLPLVTMTTRETSEPARRTPHTVIILATARTTTGTFASLTLVTMTTGETSKPAHCTPHTVIIPATARTTTGTRATLPLLTMTTGEMSKPARLVPHKTMTWQVMGQEVTNVFTTQIDPITDAFQNNGTIRTLVTTLMLTRLL